MTFSEASKKYNIPVEIMHEYERMELYGEIKKAVNPGHYDDSDIKWLSIIMTLHDVGFSSKEAAKYITLIMQGECSKNERLKMLDNKRSITLDEIHSKEKQLDRLDYLRYKIKNQK